MCDNVLEKLRTDYGDDIKTSKVYAIKYSFIMNGVNIFVYYDRYDNSDNLSLVIKYKYNGRNFYYLSPLSLENNIISKRYLNNLNNTGTDLLDKIMDENNSLDELFIKINDEVLYADSPIKANYKKDFDFKNTLDYRKRKNIKNNYAPFLNHIGKGNIDEKHEEYLKTKFNIDDDILSSFKENGFNIIGTSDPDDRTTLGKIVDMLDENIK